MALLIYSPGAIVVWGAPLLPPAIATVFAVRRFGQVSTEHGLLELPDHRGRIWTRDLSLRKLRNLHLLTR